MTQRAVPSGGPAELDAWARAAQDGDRDALQRLLEALADDMYRLALRMCWHPEDAADASQEILIKVMTRLGTWRGEASLRTWAWRIAVRHLLDRRRSRVEVAAWTFDAFAEDLADGLAGSRPATGLDAELLAEEVRLGCTQGMLQCLDRDHRLAYILGEVFVLRSDVAAEITGVTPTTYRKRLSRARAALRAFVTEHCGIVDPANACRCERRVPVAIRRGRVDPEHPLFAGHPATTRDAAVAMERLHDAAALIRAHPDYTAPAATMAAVLAALDAASRTLLDGA